MMENVVVMIVEDNDLFSKSLGLLLNTHGFEVIRCSTSSAALRAVYTHKVDAIVLDLNLGEGIISGYEFARLLSMDPDIKKIPVVIVTGRPIKEILQDSYSILKGATLMQKPILADEILKTLDNITEPPRKLR